MPTVPKLVGAGAALVRIAAAAALSGSANVTLVREPFEPNDGAGELDLVAPWSEFGPEDTVIGERALPVFGSP